MFYGTTAIYGLQSPLNSTLGTAHSVTLTGLTASTTYHYKVQSQSPQGGTATSGDMTFTTAAVGTEPTARLQILGKQTEVSGVTNGSIVTPAIAPGRIHGRISRERDGFGDSPPPRAEPAFSLKTAA